VQDAGVFGELRRFCDHALDLRRRLSRIEFHERDAALPPVAAMTAATSAAISAAPDPDTDAAARRRGAALDVRESLNFAREALTRLDSPVTGRANFRWIP
jgi:hypothetical protein